MDKFSKLAGQKLSGEGFVQSFSNAAASGAKRDAGFAPSQPSPALGMTLRNG
ncbi:MAG: hypothetical protein H6865_05425 [Rhodospirillales bacterium]|nr:hypothetical protein [Rhodospirillales bacterium]